MATPEQTAKLRELRLAKEKREREAAKLLKAARAAQKQARIDHVFSVVGESLRNGTFHESHLPLVLKAIKKA
jgi:hypothetical protein